MKSILFFISLSLITPAFCSIKAQPPDSTRIVRHLPENKNLTVSYKIIVDGVKKTGIEETYSGGNKTIFISNGHLRSRLVSLMRIESLFFTIGPDSSKNSITIVKESGKDKYKATVSLGEWENTHGRYTGLQCKLTDDTLTLLHHVCKKAIVQLADGKEITAYYTDKYYNSLLTNADPAFVCIPGLVLQYQYKRKGKSITYTATSISVNSVGRNIFTIPDSKAYVIKKALPE